MKLIKVNYKILEPVLDFHQAKDNEILVHPEEDWLAQVPVGGDASAGKPFHRSAGVSSIITTKSKAATDATASPFRIF